MCILLCFEGMTVMADGRNSKNLSFCCVQLVFVVGDSLQTETAMVNHALSESLK